MKNYANEEVIYNGCPGCAFANHEFDLPCGRAFENDRFVINQDWELPIEGMFIITPKKHIEKLTELDDHERNEMFDLINKVIKILQDNNICDRFDIVFEEKENNHFHVWIFPRHKWMIDMYKDIIGNIRNIFDYAKSNLRCEETYKKINDINNTVKEDLLKD
jgi:diadenosine tetraphosphate (Ap4A) HIT family hydrolase